jgi:hypothetical protein
VHASNCSLRTERQAGQLYAQPSMAAAQCVTLLSCGATAPCLEELIGLGLVAVGVLRLSSWLYGVFAGDAPFSLFTPDQLLVIRPAANNSFCLQPCFSEWAILEHCEHSAIPPGHSQGGGFIIGITVCGLGHQRGTMPSGSNPSPTSPPSPRRGQTCVSLQPCWCSAAQRIAQACKAAGAHLVAWTGRFSELTPRGALRSRRMLSLGPSLLG